MMRYFWIFVLGLVGAAGGLGAQNLTAPLLAGSWQSTYHNPAMVHFLPGKLTLGLPGIANDLRLQNLQYGDVFNRVAGERILNLDAWSLLVEDQNAIQDVYSIETLGLAVQTGRLGISGYHRLRVQGEAEYSSDLVDLLAIGNAPFIGRTVELAPRGELTSWQEIGLGLSYAINDKIALGGRVKYLAGVSNIQIADGGSLRLRTAEENFALSIEQNFTLNTVRAIDYSSLNDIGLLYDPNRLTPADLFGGNTGIAIDFGVAINLDRLRLNASVTDLGASINWTEEITNLRFVGTESFTGLDILQDVLRDSVSLDAAVDSLTLTFSPEEAAASYRTNLAASYWVGGEYDLSERITLGAMVAIEDRLGEAQPALALLGRYTFNDWLQAGLNLNHRTGIRTNLGLHVYATPGARFRLFASSDKFFTLLTTGNTAVAGVRLGAALQLGQSAATGRRGQRRRSTFAARP